MYPLFRRLCGLHDTDGIDALLQVVAPLRKYDPSSLEEQECVQNMFQCICSVLLDPVHQDLFRKGEGIELMVRIIKEQRYATGDISTQSVHAVIPFLCSLCLQGPQVCSVEQ
jgi:hypothetical protein